METGDVDLAEREYARVLSTRRELLGDDHPSVGQAWMAVGSVHGRRERWGDAFDAYGEALRIFRAAHGGDEHVDVTGVKARLAETTRELGRLAESERLAREALAHAETLGPTHRLATDARGELARTLLASGRAAEALPLAEAAATAWVEAHPDDPRTERAVALRDECRATAKK
jgi:tetratricopeptide (TPR) repeat protein